MNIELQQQVEQLTEKVTQLQADIERRKQQREQEQKTISALREENAQLRRTMKRIPPSTRIYVRKIGN